MKSVLIVDDEPEIVDIVVEYFSDHKNVECFKAHSGKEALEILCDNRIDLVIVDWEMPKIPGRELILKISDINPNINFICMTGYIINNDLELAKQKVEFLKKPFDFHVLKSKVFKYLYL